MVIQLLDHKTSTGLGAVAEYTPHTYRTKTIRIQVVIAGVTDSGTNDIKVKIRGRLSSEANWYEIQEVVAKWMTPTATQSKTNSDGSFAMETTAFPLMKVNVGGWSEGSGNVRANSNVTLESNSLHKETFTLNDNFGHTAVFVFHTEGSVSEIAGQGTPIEIKATKELTCSEAILVINAYNTDPHPNYKALHMTAAATLIPSNVFKLTHDIPGTGGNSATVTEDSTVITSEAFTDGVGTDRYVSCWLDDSF